MAKNYKQVDGTCSDCCLFKECKVNKQDIKPFIESKGIYCEKGKTLKVVEK